MTIEQLMAKVDWSRMKVTDEGFIRHRDTLACPICVAGGRTEVSNGFVEYVADSLRMSRSGRVQVVYASDNRIGDFGHDERTRSLRKRMLRAMGIDPEKEGA